jgi:hypothetical protein
VDDDMVEREREKEEWAVLSPNRTKQLKKNRICHFFGGENLLENTVYQCRSQVSNKLCEATFSKFHAYLTDQTLILAPVPFL